MANSARYLAIEPAGIELVALGAPRLEHVHEHERQPFLGQGKPLALVAFLAAAPRRTASRERLADLLWGDRDPEDARKSLRQALWMVSRAAGSAFIESGPEGLTLTDTLDSDVAVFERAVRNGELDDAVNRYTGDFFGTFASPGADEFERWAELERARLRALFVHAAESLARRALDRGRFADAIALARRIRVAAPLAESGWQLLLESLSASGDVIGARAEADHFEQWLRTEEHVPEPGSVASLRLARHVRAPTPPPASTGDFAADLIGREGDFARLHDLWAATRVKGARTALIVGDGGIGKTRLVADLRTRIVAARGRVTWCAARAGDRHVAYAALASVVCELTAMPGAAGISQHSAAALLALDPSLSSRFSGAPDAAVGDEALRRRGLALLELIAAVADDASFALVIDDLHWCDDESLRAIAFVAARLRDERVLLMLTTRPTRALPPLGEALTTISLAPLSAELIEQLVASVAPLPNAAWARALPPLLRRCSSGIPLLVLEALRLSVERGVLQLADDGWRCPNEEELDRTLQHGTIVGRRLGVLAPDEARVLHAIAAAEVPLPAELLAGATELDAAHITAIAGNLEGRGLIAAAGASWHVAHDEIGAVALSLADAQTLRDTHQRLGEVLGARADANWRRRAIRHFVAAADWARVADVVSAILAESPRRGALDDELLALVGDQVPGAERERIVAMLPFSTRHPRARSVAMMAAGVLAIALLSAVALARWPAVPDADAHVFIATVGGAGVRTVVTRAGLSLGRWNDGRPIDAGSLAPQGEWQGVPDEAGSPVFTMHGTAWAIDTVYADSGGMDVVLDQRDGSHRRLTSTRGDDRPVAFSPDGALLVISTSRWNANGRANLALIDGRSGAFVRRLTFGNDVYENNARWSPDGAHIAFTRVVIDRDSTRLCLLTVDATREQCRDLPSGSSTDIVGFVDESRVLLKAAGTAAFVFDLASGTVSRTMIPALGNPTLDPSGRWLLVTQASEDPSKATLVGPALAFERARPIDPRGPAGTHTIAWLDGHEPDYVAHLRIVPPRAPVMRGVPYQLAVIATTRSGKRAIPTALSWRSLSPRRASIDSDGVLLAHDTGSAIVEVSVGGWRVTVDTIRIVTATSALLADEHWTGDIASRWKFYGEPLPTIVDDGRDGRGGRAFLNNGDGVFYSGAYGAAAYHASDGIALDIDISTPVTRNQWQVISVSLDGDGAYADVGHWDHKTGYLPMRTTSEASCVFVYPQGEGPKARLRSNFANPLPKTVAGRPLELWSGAWHRLRVQLLPDGRCAAAIDGERVSVTGSSTALPATARVMLQGNSVGTRMLMGHLRVFSGVPPGVDWNTVPKQP